MVSIISPADHYSFEMTLWLLTQIFTVLFYLRLVIRTTSTFSPHRSSLTIRNYALISWKVSHLWSSTSSGCIAAITNQQCYLLLQYEALANTCCHKMLFRPVIHLVVKKSPQEVTFDYPRQVTRDTYLVEIKPLLTFLMFTKNLVSYWLPKELESVLLLAINWHWKWGMRHYSIPWEKSK